MAVSKGDDYDYLLKGTNTSLLLCLITSWTFTTKKIWAQSTQGFLLPI